MAPMRYSSDRPTGLRLRSSRRELRRRAHSCTPAYRAGIPSSHSSGNQRSRRAQFAFGSQYSCSERTSSARSPSLARPGYHNHSRRTHPCIWQCTAACPCRWRRLHSCCIGCRKHRRCTAHREKGFLERHTFLPRLLRTRGSCRQAYCRAASKVCHRDRQCHCRRIRVLHSNVG